jgi:hypothetical protein
LIVKKTVPYALGKVCDMFGSKKLEVDIYIPKDALTVVFDECDQYDFDETGGRLIGSYQKKGNKYTIEVSGVIDPGPNARRAPTSFFQDGDYQEKIFRSVEEKHPQIEHLGSWHTHHVNGLTTLSSGDRSTYQRIVNHRLHNTDFFYALLVIEKKINSKQRYVIKHYFIRRDDATIYEIPDSKIHIVEKLLVWPSHSGTKDLSSPGVSQIDTNAERVKDQEFFSEFYPDFKPLFSKNTNVFYWKGKLGLIDNTRVDVIIMENKTDNGWAYSIAVADPSIADTMASYMDRTFKSARIAIFNMERDINRGIHLKKESKV